MADASPRHVTRCHKELLKLERITCPALRSRTVFALLFCALLVGGASAQKRKSKKSSSRKSTNPTVIHRERSARENELSRLKREIADYQKQLKQHQASADRSKRNLNAFNRRTGQLRSAIAELERRVDDLEEKKEVVEDSLHTTAETLDRLKAAYAEGARFLYMNGALESHTADEILLDPKLADDHLRQEYYARLVGRAHAMNRERLDSAKHALGTTQANIASAISSQSRIMGERASEAEKVERQKQQESHKLAQIEHDRARLERILKQKQESARRLERMIADLIVREEKAAEARRQAEARRRKAAARSHAKQPKIEDDVVESGRAYGPHSLLWPTSSHHIRQGYGEHRNADLNTVTMNLGIDIGTDHGSPVRAAADGVVSIVSSLPSYGTIVVLQHSGGLHTVYANLAGVSVSASAHVKAGQTIARSGSNEELGDVLHFEVWKGKSRQNPAGWLK
jgi:septal ring factor EnvC (AmiA/AmiB activator)